MRWGRRRTRSPRCCAAAGSPGVSSCVRARPAVRLADVRPAQDQRELCAALAAELSPPHRRGVSGPRGRHPRRCDAELGADLCALPPPRLGAGAPRPARADRRGHGAQHAGDARGAFRRADGRRRAERAQHPPRRRDDRLHPGARRGQGPDRRPRVRAPWSARRSRCWTRALRRSTSTTRSAPAGRACSARRTTRRSWPEATRTSVATARRTNGTPIALNYTSGTTGNPKGVVYHHRGAYLNAVGNVARLGHARSIRSISGRCRCSTATAGASRGRVAALAGTNVCLRRVERRRDLRGDRRHGVTHLCGAPIVMGMLIHAPACERRPRPQSAHDDRRRPAARGGHRGAWRALGFESPMSMA